MSKRTPMLSKEEREKRNKNITADYKNGTSRKKLKAKYGYSDTTIMRILRESGLDPKPETEGKRGPKTTKKEREERNKRIAADYKNGMKQRDIEIKYGYSDSSVIRILLDLGLRERQKNTVEDMLKDAKKAPEPPKAQKIVIDGQLYEDITLQVAGW